MLSKLYYSGGDRRVTRQMTATQLESRNPLHVPELLENVLVFLPVEDLKSCRLVNKFWKESALQPMKKKCGNIQFFSTNYPYQDGLEDMERFLKCFSRDRLLELSLSSEDIPCTKFNIFSSIIKEKRNSDREKLVVANFFQAISPWVTEITLLGGKDFGNIMNEMEKLMFPSLKRIVFAARYITIGTRSSAFSPWMSVFIQNSHQLEEISFRSLSGLRGWEYQYGIEYQDTSVHQFLQVLAQNRNLKIKRLDIWAEMENNDLIWLSESDLKLKHLKLWIRKFPQPRISFRHLETLEIWDRDFPANEDLHFPIMKKLKSLTLAFNSCPKLINYAAQTPSLETVALEIWGNFDWPTCLSREMEPLPGVKELRFPGEPPNAEAIPEVVRIFPNISKLELVLYEHPLPLPIVYDSLPNLEELTLITPLLEYISDIDGLLTGLSEEGCQDALRRLRYWTPNFDDSAIQIGINHSPISVLKNLKLLRLRSKLMWPRKLEISKVSLCLALMKMPSLKILDLCERHEAPDESIPNTVLKEFRKNCLILWKPKAAGNR